MHFLICLYFQHLFCQITVLIWDLFSDSAKLMKYTEIAFHNI